MWYHSGDHGDYHRPTDDADKLDWDKLVRVTRLAWLTGLRLANQPAP